MCNLWHNLQLVESGQYLVEVEVELILRITHTHIYIYIYIKGNNYAYLPHPYDGQLKILNHTKFFVPKTIWFMD
jgi:hypothetical protein